MFKFIVAFFLVTNGIAADKPANVMSYNKTTFPSEEACRGFPETEEGMAAMQSVGEFVESKHGQIAVRIGCVKDEDNSI